MFGMGDFGRNMDIKDDTADNEGYLIIEILSSSAGGMSI
jgi:hypothetical protein